MKITHFISGLTKGGGERVAAELANITIHNGHEVTIISGWPVEKELLQDAISDQVDIRFVARNKKGSYLKSAFWVFRNRKFLKGQDIIHCHLSFGSVLGTLCKILLNLGKTRVVETYHAVGMNIPNINRKIHSVLLKYRDGIIMMATDPFWEKFRSKNSGIKSTIIHNGIKPLKPTEVITRDGLLDQIGVKDQSTAILIGSVSALREDRRPADYVPIMKQVIDECGDHIHFVLGGEGVERPVIEARIKEYELEKNFHLIGLVDDPQTILKNIDLYISVSVGDITGISMIEAAMCKLPVISIQMLDSYTAQKTDWCWSSSQLSEVSSRAIDLVKDESQRKNLGKTQYDYVMNNLTSSSMLNKYLDFYKMVAKA